jgi:flagellar basal body-associated protein FliL
VVTAPQTFQPVQFQQAPQPQKKMTACCSIIMAIFTTLFCCWPLGLVGLIYAFMANGLIKKGDHNGATKKLAIAKFFTFAAFVSGLIIAAGVVFYFFMLAPEVEGQYNWFGEVEETEYDTSSLTTTDQKPDESGDSLTTTNQQPDNGESTVETRTSVKPYPKPVKN